MFRALEKGKKILIQNKKNRVCFWKYQKDSNFTYKIINWDFSNIAPAPPIMKLESFVWIADMLEDKHLAAMCDNDSLEIVVEISAYKFKTLLE